MQGPSPAESSADVGFLRDLRTHHENAINIAQIALVKGDEPAVKVFAEEVIRFQSYKIGLMDRMAIEWGYRPEIRPRRRWAGWATPSKPQTCPASPPTPSSNDSDRPATRQTPTSSPS